MIGVLPTLRSRVAALSLAAAVLASALAVVATRESGDAARPQAPTVTEKEEIEARTKAESEASAKNPAPKNKGYNPGPNVVETWPTGVFDDPQAPFASEAGQFTNMWQGDVQGVHLQVFAGHKAEDKDAALVVVVRTSFDLSEVTAEYVDGPAAAGAVRITASDNGRLTLVDAKGRSWAFDVVSARFVN